MGVTVPPRAAMRGVLAPRSPLLVFALGLAAGRTLDVPAGVALLLLATWPLAGRWRPLLGGVLAGFLLSLPAGRPDRAVVEGTPLPRPGLYALEAVVVSAPPPGPRAAPVVLLTSTLQGRPCVLGIRLYPARDGTVALRQGARVRLRARLRRPRRATNPGSFDRAGALGRRGIDLVGWPVVGDPIVVSEQPGGWRHAISALRAGAAERLDRSLPGRDGALARALVLGDRSQLRPETRSRFAETGQSHILAVSGLHVGLLLAGMLFLAHLAHVGTRARWLFGVAVLALYVPLAGSPPSAVRAGLGAALYLLGRWLGRTPSPFTLLAAVVVLVMLTDPSTASEGGFRLSLAAVSGILLLTPRLQAWLVPGDLELPGIAPRPRAPLRRLLAVSLGAWLGVAPLLVEAFGRLVPTAPLISLVTVPLAMVLVASAFLLVAFGGLPFAAPALATTFTVAHEALASTLGAALDLGLGAIPAHPLGPWWWVTYGLAVVAAGLAPRRWAVGAGAVLPCLLLLACLAPHRAVPPHPRLTLLDVGHGQAALLEVPDGRVALLDCGRLGDAEPGRRIVVPALRNMAVGALDVATASHADSDHVSGFAAVHAACPIRQLIVSPGFPTDRRRAWASAGIPVRVAARGRTVLAGAWGHLDILHPPTTLPADASSNDRSLVLRLDVVGSGSLILPGDIGAEAVDALLDTTAPPRADLLVLPHHGLPAPATETFVAAVGARVCLASCGASARGTLPPGTRSTVEEGALRVDFLPGGPVVTANYAARPREYDPPRPMPSLPAPSALPPWLLPAFLLVFAVLAVRPLGWLTPGGSAAAFALGTAAAVAFGPTGLAALFAPFVVATLLGKLPGVRREGPRKLVQVAANGAVPFAGALLALLGHPETGALIYLGGLSALGADTSATEIGTRYGGTPRRLLDGRPLHPGESGGVTPLGLVASVGGALLAPAAWALVTPLSASAVALVAFAGVVAGLADSLLGATLQYRGADLRTGELTELRRHANGKTRRVSGLAWLDNDGVNLAAGLVGAAVACGLLGWLG